MTNDNRNPSARKPFMSIMPDIDDVAIEAVARAKGVPSLSAPEPQPGVAVGAGGPDADNDDAASDHGPTPRSRMAYIKACLPDYAVLDLRTRAAREKVSLNHVILTALAAAGIAIRPEDMIEDGRRLRGSRAIRGR